jgi:DNA (cytosine-5)-methyltransferase 1
MRDKKPTVISLYTGAGGLDYGFEAAGFRTAVAVEMDQDCCETLRRNRPWPVIERDIFDVTTKEMLRQGMLSPGEVDIVIGGPPCQPFSKSGYWATGDSDRLDDPRADTLSAYMQVVEEALPKVFVLENVEGLAYSKKNEGLQLLINYADRINRKAGTKYRPSARILRAADYGVPQLRERFFFVASRDGRIFSFPKATHGQVNEGKGASFDFGALHPYRTAWDAIGDVEPAGDEDLGVTGKWADLLPSIPEGQNYLWHTERGGGLPLFGWRRRYWSFLLKLAKDRPSWTVQAQPGPATGPFHWLNRRLSMRELCRIQTFPDDIVIHGSRISVQRQIGNAVPSLLAEVLARSIAQQLLGLSIDQAPSLLRVHRKPLPAAEPAAAVPKKYLELKGKHSAHPGTGRGHRAQAWAK